LPEARWQAPSSAPSNTWRPSKPKGRRSINARTSMPSVSSSTTCSSADAARSGARAPSPSSSDGWLSRPGHRAPSTRTFRRPSTRSSCGVSRPMPRRDSRPRRNCSRRSIGWMRTARSCPSTAASARARWRPPRCSSRFCWAARITGPDG
jgi:hypothetical protein